MPATTKAAFFDPPLLGRNDPPPFTIINENGNAPCLLLSEHAGSAMPEKLGTLGLADDDLGRHWAVDVGVRRVTQRLAEKLNAPAIIGNISRLVVDLNRRLEHPTAFPHHGEGTPVPGNITMTDEERALRTAEIYTPYHDAVAARLKGFLDQNIIPVVVSIHSFTPVFYKQQRPWDIGFLWAQDRRLTASMIDFFNEKGYCTGDNEPYDARTLRGTTLHRHADAQRLPNVLIELRNDLIDTDEKGDEWADMLAECLAPALAADSEFRTLYDGPVPDYDPQREMTYFDDLAEQAKKGE